jgi:two-component system, sensor histidine kinase and response regulator
MTTSTTAHRRILVVEDSRTQAEALRSLLADAGFEVVLARTGAAALDTLRASAVDLVVSDVIMPGMSGFELCAAVRADPRVAHVPFIVLTSLADPLDVMRGLECGADNYLTKPYEPEQLLQRIERTLRSHAGRTSSSPSPAIDVQFLGGRFSVASGREQILDVLISSFEDVVRTNAALRAAEDERAVLFDKERQARLESEEARRRAEEANQAKSEFLAMMSHDLRTPLNAIGGYSELLALGVRGPMNEAQLSDLERIRRNQRHLLTLVNDVLSFARLETGEIPLNLAPVELHETIWPLRAVIETQAAKRNITYEYIACDKNTRIYADAERVEQVLINLLGNAIKFTPDGGKVTMRCGVCGETGIVEVIDTGIGIPDAKLALIFDPFVQVDTNRGKREGVGLGLAISRKLARAMGGDIAVQSVEGQGSTFTLSLPLASAGTPA